MKKDCKYIFGICAFVALVAFVSREWIESGAKQQKVEGAHSFAEHQVDQPSSANAAARQDSGHLQPKMDVLANRPLPRSAVAPTLGDSLAVGVDALPPGHALELARVLARCAMFPILARANMMDAARVRDSGDRQRVQSQKEELDALERNCQTVPAVFQNIGSEQELRAKLLKRAYISGEPGAAAELMKLPENIAGVSATELRDHAFSDARKGDLKTMADLLMRSTEYGVGDEELKLYAFALQRAVRQPALRDAVEQTQILFSSTLDARWKKQHIEASAQNQRGFNVDEHGVFLYPKGYEEPSDEAYKAKARALDEALARVAHQQRKP